MSRITAALNEHLKLEYAAWHEYSAMAVWLESHDLPGFASFLKSQAEEELAPGALAAVRRRVLDAVGRPARTSPLVLALAAAAGIAALARFLSPRLEGISRSLLGSWSSAAFSAFLNGGAVKLAASLAR